MITTDRRIGAQRPRLSSIPADIANTDAGDEVIEFAERFGLVLDDWQRWVVRHMCAERSDGSWAATQNVLLVPRQAGKSALLEAIELAALFLWDYEHIIYSAHLQKTSTDHMRRIRRHIDATPDLKRACRVLTGKGDERVERNDTGAILEFITRGKKTSRGGSPGLVIFDEALFLRDDEMQAMVPALSAQSMNEEGAAQMIYTSSAPTAESTVLHRLRKRGVEDRPPRMFFAEWSAPSDADPGDLDAWYQANPGLGVRISQEWIEDNEHGTLSDDAFKVERLGIPELPLGPADSVIPEWSTLADSPNKATGHPGTVIVSDRCWALSVSPVAHGDQWASLGAAGRDSDGRLSVGFLDHRKGTHWIVERALAIQTAKPIPIRIHAQGPEGALIAPLRKAGVDVVEVSSADVERATGQVIAAASSGDLVHLGQPSLDKAVAGAVLRTGSSGAASWSQRSSSIEITPLVAVTVAAGGVAAFVEAEKFFVY